MASDDDRSFGSEAFEDTDSKTGFPPESEGDEDCLFPKTRGKVTKTLEEDDSNTDREADKLKGGNASDSESETEHAENPTYNLSFADEEGGSKTNESKPAGLAGAIEKLRQNENYRRLLQEKAAEVGTVLFYQDLIVASDFIMFAAMVPKSKYLVLIHSVGEFRQIGVPDDQWGTFGFIGNYHQSGGIPQRVSVKKTWLSALKKTNMANDINPLVSASRDELWDGYEEIANCNLTSVGLPYLLLLFPDFAAYLNADRRTPLQALDWIVNYVANNSLEAKKFKVHRDFLEAAACAKNGRSIMSLNVEAPLAIGREDEAVNRWSELRLSGTIGPRPGSRGSATKPSRRRDGQPNESSKFDQLAGKLTQFSESVAKLAEATAAPTASLPSTGSKKIVMPTKDELWNIAGWGHKIQLRLTSTLVACFQAKSIRTAHKTFVDNLKAEIANMGASEVGRFSMLESETEKFLALNLATDDHFCVAGLGKEAFSWLDALPMSEREVQEKRQKETIWNETAESQKTFELRTQVAKEMGKKTPPTLKKAVFLKTIILYCGKHRCAFGKNNEHAELTFEIRRTLLGMSEDAQDRLCTAENLLTLQFLIMQDSHVYYGQRATEHDLRPAHGRPSFPRSTLQPVINDLARGLVLRPTNFFTVWTQAQGPQEPPMSVGEMYGFGPPQPPPGPPPSFDWSEEAEKPKPMWHDDVHKEFQGAKERLRITFARTPPPAFYNMCRKAKVKTNSLPKPQKCTHGDGRAAGLCYSYLMGVCRYGNQCSKVHAGAAQLPDSFVQKLKPHVDKIADAYSDKSSKKRKAPDGTPKIDF